MARRSRPPAAARHIALAGLLLLTSGCIVESPRAFMMVVNDSSVDLGVHVRDTDKPRMTVPAGQIYDLGLGGGAGDCTNWDLEARTTDGLVVATMDAPVCDGDEWIITDQDLHQAS